jgi:hypothetical protein
MATWCLKMSYSTAQSGLRKQRSCLSRRWIEGAGEARLSGRDSVVWSTTSAKISPVDSPLRRLVEEWMESPEQAWVQKVPGPLPFQKWVERYPVRRREELAAAISEVDQLGVGKPDALVKCFVKVETSTKMVDHRNISPRSDNFLAVLGPHIAAVEHAALGAGYLVKGLDLKQRLKKMIALTEYKHFLVTDFSRFDRHISYQILQIVEYYVLSHRCHQFVMVGLGVVGIKYRVQSNI